MIPSFCSSLSSLRPGKRTKTRVKVKVYTRWQQRAIGYQGMDNGLNLILVDLYVSDPQTWTDVNVNIY